MEKRTKRKSANVPVEPDNFSSSIIQLVHDAIIVVDEDQNIILFNQGAEKTFGYIASEVIGQRLDVLLPPQVSDFHGAYVRSFAKDTEIARLMGERKEISGRRKNGVIFPAEASIAKVSSGGKIFFTAILRDITERKRAEQVLRESEKKQSMVLNGVDEIIYQVNYPEGSSVNGTVEFVSERTQEILGYRPAEFITDPNRWFNLIHPEDILTVQAQTTKIYKTGQPGLRHYRIKDINGEYRSMEDRVSPEKDKTGRVVRTFGVARDITERKYAEQQMKELSMAVEQTADCVIITDREGVIRYVNAAFEKETGYTREEALGKTPRILKSGEHDPRFYEALWKTILAGNVFRAVFINRKKTGELVYEQKTITPLKDTQGNITHFVSTAKNITEQAQAEKALRESEKQYRDLFEGTSDLIQAVAPDGRLLFANRAWREALGYTEQELTDLNIDRVVHPEALTQCFETLQRAMSGEQVDRIETRFVTKEGKSIIVEGSVACRFEGSQPMAITCFLRDITERKLAEEALRSQEARFRVLIENASDAIALISADGTFLYKSPGITRMLGYAASELIGRTFFELIHPDDLPNIKNRFGQLLQQPSVTIDAQLRLRHKDGSWRWLEGIGQNLLAEPSVQAIVANYRDITERKQAEDALQQSEKRLRQIIDLVPHFIFAKDIDGRFVLVNQAVADTYGTTVKELTGKTDADFASPEEVRHFRSKDLEVINSGKPTVIPEELITDADGHTRTLSTIKIPFTFSGTTLPAVLGVSVDITERKQMEEQLQRSEARYRAIVEDQTDLVCRMLPDGTMTFANQSYLKYFGMTLEQAIGSSVTDRDIDGQSEMIKSSMARLSLERPIISFEEYLPLPDGSKRWVQVIEHAIIEDGKVIEVQAVGRDITARKQAEDKLIRSERQLSEAQSITRLGSWEWDILANRTEWSSEFYNILGIHHELLAPITYEVFLSYVHSLDRERVVHVVEQALATKEPFSVDYRIVRPDGVERYIHTRGRVISDRDGQAVQIHGSLQDITERRQADEILRQSEEKYRTLVEQASDGILIADADGRHIEVNSRGCEMLGYTRAEILQLKISDLLKSGEMEAAPLRLDALRQGKTLLTERALVRKDGSVFPVEVSVKMLPGGQLQAIVRDITERKRAEQQLQTLLESMPDGVLAVNAEGNIIVANAQTETLFGYPREELLGQPIEMLLPERNRAIHPRHRDGYLAAPKTRSMGSGLELYARQKDGSEFPVDISLSAVETEQGRMAISVIRDITERKRAEEQLHDSEERFRATFEQAAVGIAHVGTNGSWLRVNQRLCDIVGYTRDELPGLTFQDITHPDDLQTDLNYVHQMLANEIKAYSMEKRYIRKDRSIVWINLTVSLMRETSGEPKYFISVVEDITERKRAEAERLQLLNVLESSLNEIYIFDAEILRFQYVNQGALRNLGYTREAMSAMTPLDLKPEFDEASFRNLLKPLLNLEQEKLIFHTVHRRADGSLYPVEVHLQMSDFNGKRVFHAIILDITERKQAEEETTKLYNAVEQSGDVIFITDRNGIIEYVNPAFETVTGYSKEESLGKWPNIISSGLMEVDDYERIWKTILSGEVFRGEIIDRKKGGEIFYYDQTITPLKDARGNITHFVSTGKDVTERKRAEEEIRQRLSELEVLYESGLAISQLLQPKEIAQKIINLLDQKLDWHHTTIRLYHPQDDTLELLAFNQPGLRSEQEKRALEERFKTSIAKKGQGLSGWVVEHGQSVRTSDLMHDTRYVETFPGLQSGLYVPIIIGKQIIGVISIESEEADAFSEADERLVATLAAQAASALENARLFEETKRRLERLQSLHAIDKAITGSMDISLILDVIIGQVISQLNADAAVILLYDQTAEALKYAKGSGFCTQALQHTCLPLGEGYAGRVALGRQMIQIPDLQTRKTDFLRSPTFSQEGFVSYIGVPLIANGEIKGVMEIFHRAAFDAETDWLNFLEALAVQTAIAIDNATLFKNLQLSNVELSMAYDATIAGWSHALDLRDKETEGHTQRVTELTERLARDMNISDAEIVHIRRGALLHDIGKMGVPDGILLKPDKLTDEEWDIMKRHPQFAYDMLAPIAYLKPALDIPYCHHERWDGTGYPRGLKGEQIPLVARIFAMADVYDALTSDRPYRKAWSKEKTLEHIREQSGTHFDPQLLNIFLAVVGKVEEK